MAGRCGRLATTCLSVYILDFLQSSEGVGVPTQFLPILSKSSYGSERPVGTW